MTFPENFNPVQLAQLAQVKVKKLTKSLKIFLPSGFGILRQNQKPSYSNLITLS